MIKQITGAETLEGKNLETTCCGRRILSYFRAYGLNYDFCRFYENQKGMIMLIINSTLLIFGDEFDTDELKAFALMNEPFRIEGSQKAILALDGICGYQKLNRTLFRLVGDDNPSFKEEDVNFNPLLDEVYEILSEGFPNILEYPLWLADTSHRVRHGISKVFTYKNSTTASISYDIDGNVLVGQVATKASARGSGYARQFLKWLADYLDKQKKTAFLYALDTRESFYREIGFEIYYTEKVLEKIDSKNESAVKGRLSKND